MPYFTPFDQFSRVTRKGWFVGASFFLRLAMGFLFLNSGWSKLTSETWTAASYLQNATGPFATWFQSLAANPVVDMLNVYGQIAIGCALILGILVRPAAFFGALMTVMYYLAQFTQNTAHGFVDDHIIFAIIFLVFMAGGFGHIWGFDSIIGRQPALQKKQWVQWLFG